MTAFEAKVLGAVLAGGRSSRCAPLDKRWLVWRGEPLWWHSASRLAQQCAGVTAVVDDDPERYRRFARVAGGELQVVLDRGAAHQGPLAGVVTGLAYASHHGYKWLLTAPCDCINVPRQLCHALLATMAPAAYLHQAGDDLYTLGLWHTSLLPALNYRVMDGDTSLRRALVDSGATSVSLPVNESTPALVNINNLAAWHQLSANSGAGPMHST